MVVGVVSSCCQHPHLPVPTTRPTLQLVWTPCLSVGLSVTVSRFGISRVSTTDQLSVESNRFRLTTTPFSSDINRVLMKSAVVKI